MSFPGGIASWGKKCHLAGACLLALSPAAVSGSFSHTREGFPGLAALAEERPKMTNAALVSSSMVQSSNPQAPRQAYLPVALSMLSEDIGGNWRTFRVGFVGIDAPTAAFEWQGWQKRRPRLTVIETTAGDLQLPVDEAAAGLEGLLRQGLAGEGGDFLVLHAATPETVAAALANQPVPTIIGAERVAAHYGVPSFDAGSFLAGAVRDGRIDQEALFGENGAPNDAAQRLIGEELSAFLRSTPAASEPRGPLPPPLFPERSLQAPVAAPYGIAEFGDGWLDWQESPLDDFYHVLKAGQTASPLSLRFQGRELSTLVIQRPGSSDMEISIDGGEWKPLVFSGSGDASRPAARRIVLARGTNPDRVTEVRLRPAASAVTEETGDGIEILRFYADGEIVRHGPAVDLSPVEAADAVYASLPEIDYQPPPNRWQHLERTRATLAEGGKLTVLCLGDSIINDMNSSGFEHLIMREWPGSEIRLVTSVRGSTGCWFYAQDGKVEEYVTRFDPDLVVIGGISHRGDAEAVRSVIQQTRSTLPETEFLLLTGPLGQVDPINDPNWQRTDRTFNTALERVAREENAAYFDMQGAWADYIVRVAGSLRPFKRDPIHANRRGQQLLGRLLARFLGPDNRLYE